MNPNYFSTSASLEELPEDTRNDILASIVSDMLDPVLDTREAADIVGLAETGVLKK